jgi:hypothetical protein
MEQKTNTEILKEIEEKSNRWGSWRKSFEQIEGKPTGNPTSRHTCTRCSQKRYERDMILTGFTKENNYKTWMTWKCKSCQIII